MTGHGPGAIIISLLYCHLQTIQERRKQQVRDRFFIKNTGIAACIMGIMMFAVVLFSAFYIAVETGHDCEGEDCPICACIEQCRNTLRQIGDGMITLIITLLPAAIFFSAVSPATPELAQRTPVSQKIRLND